MLQMSRDMRIDEFYIAKLGVLSCENDVFYLAKLVIVSGSGNFFKTISFMI